MSTKVDIKSLSFELKKEFDTYLIELIKSRGSDLHIRGGGLIRKRIKGEIMPMQNKRALTSKEALILAKEILVSRFDEFVEKKTIDVIYRLGNFRFRGNIFFQMDGVSMAFRLIPERLPTFQSLKFPDSIREICENNHTGLILVTGPTGSGKSTTLASMINHFNETRNAHVITIEDPIEFAYREKNCIINQRNIGYDTVDFASSLRSALREDPDIILVGEMRDAETADIVLQAAQTGHLVLSTLHTPNATDSISRIISMFSGEDRKKVRLALALSLRAIVSQKLCLKADKSNRVAALEILINTPRVSKLILENKDEQLTDAISEAGLSYGMQTFDMHLIQLYQEGILTKEETLKNAPNPGNLSIQLRNVDAGKKADDDSGDEGATKDITEEIVLK